MARIPDDVIERIKTEISLVRLVEQYGIALEKRGRSWMGRCPFHDDKTPSFSVSETENLYHCFGCGAAGNNIQWVEKMEGLSFNEAAEAMEKDLAGLGRRSAPVRRTRPDTPEPFQPTEADQALLNEIGGKFYHRALLDSPDARAFLERRGLDERELIERFRLGHANRTLAYRVPDKKLQAGKALREQLQRVGLYRESGHEHLNGSLTVPIFDEHNNIVQIYGRKIRDDLRKGTPKHLYLPGPHRGVFNREGFTDTEELIICEAILDALTLWKAGFKNVTSSYGVNGFTDEMLQAMKYHGIKRALIAYDRDEAGDTAAAKLAERLINEGIDCYRLQLPKGMDVNEYALQVQPAEKSLGVLIRSAEWIGGANGAQDVTSADGHIIEHAPPPEPSQAKAQFEQQLKEVSAQLNKMDAPATPDAPAEPLPAKAVPDAPQDIEAEVTETGIHIPFGPRRYRIRGFEQNTNYRVMKINLLVRSDQGLHVDTFDFYHHKARNHFIRAAAVELDVDEPVIKADLEKLLCKIELMQEERLREAARPKDETVQLSETDEAEALKLLKQPDLLNRIVHDIEHAGLVGEQTNSLVGYLACISRRLDKPLAILVQSTSAAGKSSLMDAVLALMPEEEREQYSAMTGQSLFYMGETNLKHKILAIAEEEGVAQASYALKLLQSEGKLSIASTAKDPQTGRLETQPYRVEGPVMLFLTSTAIDIDDELMNRCLVLSVNESREQTRAIHRAQRHRRTLEGFLAQVDTSHVRQVHQNAQRLIKPLTVINPYADYITFVDDKTRTRRDQEKYLTLIESIALVHQYQREIKTAEQHGQPYEYIEVELSDIEIGNRLAHEVLGQTLDELPPQTRTLLNLLHEMVQERCRVEGMEQSDYRFSRRDVREATGWGNTQLKIHLARLVDLEYLLIHGRGQRHFYELLYQGEGEQRERFMMGLIDVERLKHEYDSNRSGVKANRSGQNDNRSAPGRGVVGGRSAPGRGKQNGKKPNGSGTYKKTAKKRSKSTAPGTKNNAGRTVPTSRNGAKPVTEDEDG